MYKGIAVVLARAGSKGLKDKNIRLLSGRPLIFHTLHLLASNNNIKKIIVSTDGEHIRQIIDDANLAKVEVYMRPAELAGDDVTTQETLKHVFNSLPPADKSCAFFVYMQVTEPVRPLGILDKCISVFRDNECDSVFAAYEMHKNFWVLDNTKASRLSPLGHAEKPRQKKEPIYREDTGICCVTAPEIFANGNRVGTMPIIISYDHPGAFVDIHCEADLVLAEKILQMEGSNVE